MYSLENIFTFHAPKNDQAERYEKLRAAAKEYAEVLIRDRTDEDDEYDLECAYEQYIRLINELIPTDCPQYDCAIKYIDEAYDLAVDSKLAIVKLVQAASMFTTAAIAINE